MAGELSLYEEYEDAIMVGIGRDHGRLVTCGDSLSQLLKDSAAVTSIRVQRRLRPTDVSLLTGLQELRNDKAPWMLKHVRVDQPQHFDGLQHLMPFLPDKFQCLDLPRWKSTDAFSAVKDILKVLAHAAWQHLTYVTLPSMFPDKRVVQRPEEPKLAETWTELTRSILALQGRPWRHRCQLEIIYITTNAEQLGPSDMTGYVCATILQCMPVSPTVVFKDSPANVAAATVLLRHAAVRTVHVNINGDLGQLDALLASVQHAHSLVDLELCVRGQWGYPAWDDTSPDVRSRITTCVTTHPTLEHMRIFDASNHGTSIILSHRDVVSEQRRCRRLCEAFTITCTAAHRAVRQHPLTNSFGVLLRSVVLPMMEWLDDAGYRQSDKYARLSRWDSVVDRWVQREGPVTDTAPESGGAAACS